MSRIRCGGGSSMMSGEIPRQAHCYIIAWEGGPIAVCSYVLYDLVRHEETSARGLTGFGASQGGEVLHHLMWGVGDREARYSMTEQHKKTRSQASG